MGATIAINDDQRALGAALKSMLAAFVPRCRTGACHG
jgi:hypothetical protein